MRLPFGAIILMLPQAAVCIIYSPNEGAGTQRLIGRGCGDDGIYYYGLHGRGPGYAYDTPKNSLSIFKDYIAIVSPPSSSRVAQNTSLRSFGGSQADDLFSVSNFTILHTDLKFIAHQEAMSSQPKYIFKEWGDLFIFTLDGKVSFVYAGLCSSPNVSRSSDTMRRPYSRSSSSCTSEIFTSWQSTLLRSWASIRLSRTSSTADMVTTSTRNKTTILQCSNT